MTIFKRFLASTTMTTAVVAGARYLQMRLIYQDFLPLMY